MKIGIYTSTSISIFDRYNISKIISTFKTAEILIVAVQSNDNSKISSLKQFLIQFRDGKNYFKSDAKKIEREIIQNSTVFNLKNASYHLVKNVNDQASESLFKEFQPDFIIQSGAGILKENIFNLSKIATLNIHHGLAPEIRGMNSTIWCLLFGLTDMIGVTCHMIDKNLDTGNVIKQYKYQLSHSPNFIEIQKILCYEGSNLLIDSIRQLIIDPNPKFSEKEIESYYFGPTDYREYNKLRKNNFNQLNNINLKKSTLKIKKTMIVH